MASLFSVSYPQTHLTRGHHNQRILSVDIISSSSHLWTLAPAHQGPSTYCVTHIWATFKTHKLTLYPTIDPAPTTPERYAIYGWPLSSVDRIPKLISPVDIITSASYLWTSSPAHLISGHHRQLIDPWTSSPAQQGPSTYCVKQIWATFKTHKLPVIQQQTPFPPPPERYVIYGWPLTSVQRIAISSHLWTSSPAHLIRGHHQQLFSSMDYTPVPTPPFPPSPPYYTH